MKSMIRVDILVANENKKIHRNASFTGGYVYYGRMSKDGKSYVVQSDEGYWIPLIHYTWARSGASEFIRIFSPRSGILVGSYKDVKSLPDPHCLYLPS
jgi:hypothetical protein